MPKALKQVVVLLATFVGQMLLGVPLAAVAETAGPPPAASAAVPLAIREVKPGLFLISGRGGGNSVARLTEDGIILIDNNVMRDEVYLELKRSLAEKASSKPIKFAFITHHHADHGGNNQKLIDDAVPLIGHTNLAGILRSYKSTIAPRNPAPPTMAFCCQLEVTTGGVKAQAFYWGPAHTDADIAIYFPDQKVIVSGDLVVSDGEPDIDALDGKGSLLGLQARLGDLLKVDFSVLIPGHGEPMSRDQVLKYKIAIDELVRRGRAAVKSGVAPGGLVSAMRAQDLEFNLVGHFWTEPARLQPIYDELRREQ